MSWQEVVYILGLVLISDGFILGIIRMIFLGLNKSKRENEYKELVELLKKMKDRENK